MLEILNFIFRDIWTFCGVVVILVLIGEYCIALPLSAITRIFHKNNKDDKKEEGNIKDVFAAKVNGTIK